MRKFTKVSFDTYLGSIGNTATSNQDSLDILNEYKDILLPRRATQRSAGYDFFAPFSFSLEPHESIKIPTSIKCYMNPDEVLEVYIRSSLGFKYHLSLANWTGIVDSDYVDNESNEGHIFIKLVNHGDKTVYINKGEAIAQGIFKKYYTTDDDEPVLVTRIGGIGSTNK